MAGNGEVLAAAVSPGQRRLSDLGDQTLHEPVLTAFRRAWVAVRERNSLRTRSRSWVSKRGAVATVDHGKGLDRECAAEDGGTSCNSDRCSLGSASRREADEGLEGLGDLEWRGLPGDGVAASVRDDDAPVDEHPDCLDGVVDTGGGEVPCDG